MSLQTVAAPRKFRLRHVFERSPFLDGLRLDVLSWLCWRGISIIEDSYDVQKVFSQGAREFLASGSPAVFALYHQQLSGVFHLDENRGRVTILISESRDGEIIDRAIRSCGFATVRGSPARGAVKGTRQILREARRGQHIAITVDGPRGPIYDFKPGIVKIAQMTGLPIIPTVFSAKYKKLMHGWDKFMIPTWGTSLLCVFDDPVFVARSATEADLELIRQQLDSRMTHMKEHADRFWI